LHPIGIPHWVWPAALVGTVAFALWRGRRPERVAAASMVLAWVLTVATYDRLAINPEWGLIAVDGVLFLVLLGVALTSSRYWPLFAAGFQLLGVITHVARQLDPKVGAWAYITAGVIWSYLVLIALAVGTYGRVRERRQIAAMEAAAIAEPGATRL
jgi:hypothetical protein